MHAPTFLDSYRAPLDEHFTAIIVAVKRSPVQRCKSPPIGGLYIGARLQEPRSRVDVSALCSIAELLAGSCSSALQQATRTYTTHARTCTQGIFLSFDLPAPRERPCWHPARTPAAVTHLPRPSAPYLTCRAAPRGASPASPLADASASPNLREGLAHSRGASEELGRSVGRR